MGTWAKQVEIDATGPDQTGLGGKGFGFYPGGNGEPGRDSRSGAARSNLYFKKIPWGNVDAKSHPAGLRPSRWVIQSTLKIRGQEEGAGGAALRQQWQTGWQVVHMKRPVRAGTVPSAQISALSLVLPPHLGSQIKGHLLREALPDHLL